LPLTLLRSTAQISKSGVVAGAVVDETKAFATGDWQNPESRQTKAKQKSPAFATLSPRLVERIPSSKVLPPQQ
jgi:hypothetical protein